MNKFRNHLLATAALFVLAVTGSVMSSRRAEAQGGGPSTTIAGPLPLPVTGTVNANQSGAWNVGLQGTPNVAATQSGAWTVQVGITSAKVFRATLNAAGVNSVTNTTSNLLVVELVSGTGSLSPLVGSVVPTHLSITNSGEPVAPDYQFFGPVTAALGLPTIHEITKIYVKPGETLTLTNPNGFVNLSGHYE